MIRKDFRSQLVLHRSKAGVAAAMAVLRALTTKLGGYACTAAAMAVLRALTTKLGGYAGSAAARAVLRALTNYQAQGLHRQRGG